MSLPREPFSWDGEADDPVPLQAAAFDDSEIPASYRILDDAETLVLRAQEAINREETDPTITIPPTVRDDRAVFLGRAHKARRSLSRRSLTILLALACGSAFLHGWSIGAGAAEVLPPNPVTRTTVRTTPSQ